jgi:23S rRNA (guanine745-N1)-methyltransferase
MMIENLRCLICQSAFQENPQGLVCSNRHQFDRSKEGYFNLLPVQHKNSLTPGDAKEQLKARREFLQAGFFDPLKLQLFSLIDPSTKTLLDLGCGEGYFTRGIASDLPAAEIYAVDIAKAGISMAAKSAKAFPNITHLVASNFDLPLQDQSMDIILRILAPSKDSELRRVLKPDGKLLVVIPGEQHLIELRKKIYPEIRPLQSLPEIEGFVLKEETSIKFAIELNDSNQMQSLLEMTPFAWKLNQQKKDLIFSGHLSDQAEFLIGQYRRIPILTGGLDVQS